MSDLAVSLVRGPLIGTCLGSFLYGTTCLQALFYFQAYANDRLGLKLTVALLLTLETIHVALSMWLMDYYLVNNYGNERVLQSATWFVMVTYSVGFIIDSFVYLYFTWRIWMFTRKLWIVFFMTSVALARIAGGVAASTLSVLSSTWVSYLERDRSLILAASSFFLIGDTFSASVMAWHLSKSRDNTLKLQPTNMLVTRCIAFVVATGGITVVVDILMLVW
ncbi:hypothetical protein F5J12DRAFT_839036 [Pisolithus orientalis]|uniref:uncharacterized protein n=1 Tax=Pisolithus orientalis TaxID=936130 RepID=UPI002224D0AE|nr:uncharacterized protein F5J12DRAFT_839036 [Pisolithus orientalis]KAI6003203.1 hypothetical protein F5J12DRAFT_839036 [Pisolithus orientalis]